MMFKIFQTVLKNPPEGVLYSVPIFSKRATCGGVVISEPWIADGFYFLLKDTSFKSAYEIARVPADGGIGSNDCIKFADGARAEYSFNRQIQVCFWKKRSEIADLTKYIENNPENTDDWAV